MPRAFDRFIVSTSVFRKSIRMDNGAPGNQDTKRVMSMSRTFDENFSKPRYGV